MEAILLITLLPILLLIAYADKKYTVIRDRKEIELNKEITDLKAIEDINNKLIKNLKEEKNNLINYIENKELELIKPTDSHKLEGILKENLQEELKTRGALFNLSKHLGLSYGTLHKHGTKNKDMSLKTIRILQEYYNII